MKERNYRALVVLSGGQDSTTCLYWAFKKFGQSSVMAVSFDYGQRHSVELSSAKKICGLTNTKHTILPINTFIELGGNSLTDDIKVETHLENKSLEQQNNLPNTFVPGRNLIFLSFAAALAYQNNIFDIVTGVAETDYSGYPDCRENTLQSLQQTLNLGMEAKFKLHTPLMFLSKKETINLAQEVGAMHALSFSHTCYNGIQPGCGECAACLLRAKGFLEAGINDPLFENKSEIKSKNENKGKGI